MKNRKFTAEEIWDIFRALKTALDVLRSGGRSAVRGGIPEWLKDIV
jgi:hypothetical protein